MIKLKNEAPTLERYNVSSNKTMRFDLMVDSEEYAFISIKDASVILAGYYGGESSHDTVKGNPNFDLVIDILYLFSVYDEETYDKLLELLKNSKDHDILVDSAQKFINKHMLKWYHNFSPAV